MSPSPIKQWHRAALAWARETFGAVALDRRERAMRLVEEALELGQAEGLSVTEVGAIVCRVYARPPGKSPKKIGQVSLTLAMLATNIGVSPDRLARIEFDRVRAIPKEVWATRHAAKVAVGAAVREEEAA